MTISFDDVAAAELQPGRFFVINAEPGSHVLVAGDGIPSVVQARANDKAFVCVGRHVEVGPSRRVEIPALDVATAEQARPDLVNLVYVTPKKIYSSVVAKSDPFAKHATELKTRHSRE